VATRPTASSIAKEIKLSRWLFGIFTVLTGALSAIAFFIANLVEGGWIVATCVGALAWALADHFGKQLGAVAESDVSERSNSTPHTDARDVPASARGSGARAGERER
jgi:hypothetical protein